MKIASAFSVAGHIESAFVSLFELKSTPNESGWAWLIEKRDRRQLPTLFILVLDAFLETRPSDGPH
jgi:hypothetical protein